MTLSLQIRSMIKSDIPRVGNIFYRAYNSVSSKHGFPQKIRNPEIGKVWAWNIMRYGPSVRLVAEVDGQVAGIACLNPRGTLGGIGPVAVDPDFQQGLRREPIGQTLVSAIFKQGESLQSIRGFQEAFNTVSFNIAYLMGLVPVETLLHLSYSRKSRNKAIPVDKIAEATLNNLDELLAYDTPRSTLQRREDLIYYIRWGHIFINRSAAGDILGFLACLPGTEGVQLGPLVANKQEQAIELFQKAMLAFETRTLRTRTMSKDSLLNKTLLQWGYKVESVDLLIVRGLWRPGEPVEAFGTFPEGV
jgi:hypothetical protein